MIGAVEAWERVSRNLRYHLWRTTPDQTRWPGEVSRRLRKPWPTERVEALLEGRKLTDREIVDLVRSFETEIDEETLQLGDLVLDSKTDVLRENLRYLIGTAEHGEKQKIAEALGVVATTISRWLNGTNRPPAGQQETIARHFGLPPSTNLEADCLFLAYGPLSLQSRRRWLRERVDELTLDEMRDLFPALQRLFRRP
jgi:transcriptional regulator with XRE-family HTH domain